MIDVALIASRPYLGELSALGTIDMALTHLVLAQPACAAYFRERAQAGIAVFLDNSAYELQETTGAGMAAEPVLEAAHRIGAQLVVCQDVPFDGPATVAATRRFLQVAADRHGADGGAGPWFMGVPQGETRAEWLACYHELLVMPGIDVIGLSKLSVPRCFDAPVAEARVRCVAHLLDHDAPRPFHLLGGDRSLPWELREHRRLGHDRAGRGGVRSNDSSFAFWYAACGIGVDGRTGRAEREAATRPDLVAGALTQTGLGAALGHARLLRDAAGVAKPPPGSPGTPPRRRPADRGSTSCR